MDLKVAEELPPSLPNQDFITPTLDRENEFQQVFETEPNDLLPVDDDFSLLDDDFDPVKKVGTAQQRPRISFR